MENTQNVVPVPLTRGRSYTLAELADCYMACYDGHDEGQGRRLRFFVEHLGDRLAHELDPDEIQDALDALMARGKVHNIGGRIKDGKPVLTGKPLAASTFNRYRSTLQACLTWAKKKRLMPKGWTNPVNETEQLREKNARVRYLTTAEYERLVKVAKVSTWPKLPLLIKLAVTTGARKSSLLGLRWQDIDLDSGRAHIEQTKNGEPFTLVLLESIVAELKALRGKAKDTDLVFCGTRRPDRVAKFYAVWRATLATAKIEGACFHTLRHTHASWLAQQGASLLAIADSMNHKSLSMTRRYSHLCVDGRAEMLTRVFNATA